LPQGVNAPGLPGVKVKQFGSRSGPAALRKVWWEQVTVPRAAQALAADVLWVPYWAAPWWQPLPVCVTVHDLIPQLLPAYRGGLHHRAYTALVGATARRAAAVITVSHAAKRDIVAQLGIPAERVHVIHHGPTVPTKPVMADAQQTAVARRYALPARYFLYLGGFDVRKNVASVLRAYARYLELGGDPAVRLVLAGQLPARDRALTPDPRRQAAQLGLGDAVHCCGFVAEEDKPALYAGAVAFLFPSRYEGFGMPVLEAMAAGTPVITAR
jgi:glycosyltransferase involved in cell wall biosynthesis